MNEKYIWAYDKEGPRIDVECPNKILGYPKDFPPKKFRLTNICVYHCPISKNVWCELIDRHFYVGPSPNNPFGSYINDCKPVICDCIKLKDK